MANDKKTLWMWLDKQKERKSIQLIHQKAGLSPLLQEKQGARNGDTHL